MLNNNKIFILLIVVFVFLIITIISLFYINKKLSINTSRSDINENQISSSTSIKTSRSDINENQISSSTPLETLKSNHPEFNSSQLNFYEQVANSDEDKMVESCLGRQDEKDCIGSVAFLRGDYNICHELHHESGLTEVEQEQNHYNCFNAILKTKVDSEIDQCQSLEGDDFINCLRNVFLIYKGSEECYSLPNEESQAICEDIFNYKDAFLSYDRALCSKVVNSKLNHYCLENILDKSQDSDSDGLTDLDEINIYHTSEKYPDTDGDGYSDGEEVKNGFNPKGPGKIK